MNIEKYLQSKLSKLLPFKHKEWSKTADLYLQVGRQLAQFQISMLTFSGP